MEIEGKIILDLPLQSGTTQRGTTWQKKEYVLETMGTYPRKVCFSVFGDRVQTVRCELGKSYKVSVDIESREYNGRWYTDVRAFACIEIPDQYANGGYPQQPQATSPFGAPQAAPQPTAFPGVQSAPVAPGMPVGSQDDLPF
ncbi:MAG: DUF3127 domain-containing protein [Bacteroides sp.]|nr:DUF3127 domain-containing protein [Bacteroides sp.]